MTTPVVENLYSRGCPNQAGERELVARVSARLGVEPDVRLLEVGDAAAAQEQRFLGSPTVRVDGLDVEPGAGERDGFVLACRIYRTGAGLQGQPDEGWVLDALRKGAAA
jgi:hypothetical protein